MEATLTMMVTQKEYTAITSQPVIKQELDNASIRLKIDSDVNVARSRMIDKGRPDNGMMTRKVTITVSAGTIAALTNAFELLMANFPYGFDRTVSIKASGDGSTLAQFVVYKKSRYIKQDQADLWTELVNICWVA